VVVSLTHQIKHFFDIPVLNLASVISSSTITLVIIALP